MTADNHNDASLIEWVRQHPECVNVRTSLLWLPGHFEVLRSRKLGGGHQTARYFELQSVGRLCKYCPVVATDACPSVACTKWIGAPRSSARVAWL